MKKKVFIILLFVLAGSAIYLWLQPDDSAAFRQELRDFSVEHPEQVDKIFISDKNGDATTLNKEGGVWKVNGKFNARPEIIETLLHTIERVKVKNRIPKEGLAQIVKNIAIENKKIEIYANGELIKCYFIGGKTMDSRGTYMLMQDVNTHLNSSVPFVTHIEGFEGYLNERYIAKTDVWRDTRILSFPEMNIKSIEMNYPAQAAASFKITIGEGKIMLFPLHSNVPDANANTALLKTYLLNFKEIAAESFITQGNKIKLDSLLRLQPTFVLTVVDSEGKKTSIKAYPRKTQLGETDYAGKAIDYDVDRFYGITMNDEELCILQFYVFDRLTKARADFTSIP